MNRKKVSEISHLRIAHATVGLLFSTSNERFKGYIAAAMVLFKIKKRSNQFYKRFCTRYLSVSFFSIWRTQPRQSFIFFPSLSDYYFISIFFFYLFAVLVVLCCTEQFSVIKRTWKKLIKKRQNIKLL